MAVENSGRRHPVRDRLIQLDTITTGAKGKLVDAKGCGRVDHVGLLRVVKCSETPTPRTTIFTLASI